MSVLGKVVGYSLVELMIVVALLAVLTVVGVASYREHTITATISSLLPLAGQAKNDVEIAHIHGTKFGTGSTQVYVAESTANPQGLKTITRVDYGCVDIAIDVADFNLDTSNTLIMTVCPSDDSGSSIDWNCGYNSSSTPDYLKYLPKECQTSNDASIADPSF